MYVIKQKFTWQNKGEKTFCQKKTEKKEKNWTKCLKDSMSYIWSTIFAIQKIHIQNAHLNSLYTEKLIKYNKKRFFPQKYKIKVFKKDVNQRQTCSQTCQVWKPWVQCLYTTQAYTHAHSLSAHTTPKRKRLYKKPIS